MTVQPGHRTRAHFAALTGANAAFEQQFGKELIEQIKQAG